VDARWTVKFARERVNRNYMSWALRLTLLAPEIVEAILDGPHLG